MDRVIHKDILDLIYKESHLDKMKRLNEEYNLCFVLEFDSVFYIDNNKIRSHINDRDLKLDYTSIVNFKLRRTTNKLPKRYFYSSGHSELKWIE